LKPDMKTHLLSLEPGERFRVEGDSEVFSVIEGAGDTTAFLDSKGEPVSGRALALRNGGSMFAKAIPSPKKARV
jgi:hypothetical protein